MEGDTSDVEPAQQRADGPQRPGRRYEITVEGRLDPSWSPWFDGLEVTASEDGTTVIGGPVVDQSALHGLLNKLRDLGLPLRSVAQLPIDPSTNSERT